jgi:hypothetical protein
MRQGFIKQEIINDSWLVSIGKPTGTVSSLGISAFGLAYDPASDKSIITAYKITAYKNPIEVQPKNSNLAPFTL